MTKSVEGYKMFGAIVVGVGERGVDLRYIQELLDHQCSKTTEIYTHVRTKSLGKIKSPLDRLKLNKGGDK